MAKWSLALRVAIVLADCFADLSAAATTDAALLRKLPTSSLSASASSSLHFEEEGAGG